MSDDWFNIRFGIYHLQIGPNSGITWKANRFQKEWRENQPHTWRWFAIYTFFGRHL